MDSVEFLASDGYRPIVWGKSMWLSMTIVASNFPLVPTKRQSISYYRFFQSLMDVLPCKSCRIEYCKMVGRGSSPMLRLNMTDFVQGPNEVPGAARKRVFSWVVRIHAHVNRRLGKKRRSSVHFWAKQYGKLRRASSNVSRTNLPSGDT